MYRCEIRETLLYGDDRGDEHHMERWLWHHNNCTCPLMDHHYYHMVAQDDHVRAYWEAEGRLIVRWDTEYGMLLEYPKSLHDMMEIGYPY